MHSVAATSAATVAVATSSRFRLLFCHGLGSSQRDVISKPIQKWAIERDVQLETMNYNKYGDSRHIWNINDWRLDLATFMRKQSSLLCDTTSSTNKNPREDSPKSLSKKTIVVCYSASTQAFLRAFLDLSAENLFPKNDDSLLAGLLFIAPGVGMNINNYMERLMPGSFEQLKSGQVLQHPAADPNLNIQVNLKCLEEFVNNCVIQKCKNFQINCPVRIIHGFYDKLVPYNSSIELMEKITAKDKALYIINDGHFIKDQRTINFALDSLWNALNSNPKKD